MSAIRPWATVSLLAANAVIWIVMVAQGAGFASTPGWMLLAWGGNSTVAVQHGEWWRLATAMFLHGGGAQLFANLVGLAAVGTLAERYYGAWAMLLVYVGAGLVGHALCLHAGAQGAVSVGATAAVAGLTGAAMAGQAMQRWQAAVSRRRLASSPSSPRRPTRVPRHFPGRLPWIVTGAWSVQALANSALAGGGSFLISPAGILGGALTGSVLGMLAARGGRALDGGRGLVMALALACASVVTIASTAPKAKMTQGTDGRADPASAALRVLQP